MMPFVWIALGVLVGFAGCLGYGLIVIRQKEKRAAAALAAFRREQLRADLRAAFDRLVARHGGTVLEFPAKPYDQEEGA
jgi:hypothetical protein